jgi:hypothetical protein
VKRVAEAGREFGVALGLTVGYCLQDARALARYSLVAGVPARELILSTRSDWERVHALLRRSRAAVMARPPEPDGAEGPALISAPG